MITQTTRGTDRAGGLLYVMWTHTAWGAYTTCDYFGPMLTETVWVTDCAVLSQHIMFTLEARGADSAAILSPPLMRA